jgi:hypothetical protein
MGSRSRAILFAGCVVTLLDAQVSLPQETDGSRTVTDSQLQPADQPGPRDADERGYDVESAALPVTIADVRHVKVFWTAQGPIWSCWVSPWLGPDGSIRVGFLTIEGTPTRPSDEWGDASDEELLSEFGVTTSLTYCASRDQAKTWQLMGRTSSQPVSPAPVAVSPRAYLDDQTLMGTGAIWFTWNDVTGKADLAGSICSALSNDHGRTWHHYARINDPETSRMFNRGAIVRRDGTVVLPAYGSVTQSDATEGVRGSDIFLYVSADSCRSWEAPVALARGTATLSCEEPAAVELANGDPRAVVRYQNPSGFGAGALLNCGQIVVKRLGDAWVPGPIQPTGMQYRGHPGLLRTREGVLVCAGTWNQCNLSVAEGQTWSETVRLPDPQYEGIGHSKALSQLPTGRGRRQVGSVRAVLGSLRGIGAGGRRGGAGQQRAQGVVPRWWRPRGA